MSSLNLVWHQEAKKEVTKSMEAGAILSLTAINLNDAALSLLGYPDSVNLAYDANAKVIAVKAQTENDDNSLVAFETTKKLKDGSVTIRSKEFMSSVINEMGIVIEGRKKLSCPASYNGRRKMLIIQVLPVEEVEESE